MSRSVLVFILLATLLPPFAFALTQEKQVATVNDDAIVQLDSKEEVRLAGIVIPESYRVQAVQLLKSKALDAVVLHYGKNKHNRYKQLLAQVYTSDGTWVQQMLLEKGYAYVYVVADNDLLVAEMLVAEQKARAAGLGVWKTGDVPVLLANEIKSRQAEFKGRFVIVEGVVAEVKKTKKRTYINFDEDWKTDFTASIKNDYKKAFKAVDLNALVGKKVRVRGWVESYNGPFMELYHASHVEALSAQPGAM